MLYITFFDKSSAPLVCFHPSSKTCNTLFLFWFNGSLGYSSLIRCFYELGPWIFFEKRYLQPNLKAWNHRSNNCNLGAPNLSGQGCSFHNFCTDNYKLLASRCGHQHYFLICCNQIIVFLYRICQKHRKPYT